MKVLKNYQKTTCGLSFSNVWRILKCNTKKESYYLYQIKDLLSDEHTFTLYRCKHKIFIFNRLSMPIFMVLYNILFYFLVISIYLPKRYFNGGYWFIRNTSWYQDVVFFGWANIFIIISLLIFIFLK